MDPLAGFLSQKPNFLVAAMERAAGEPVSSCGRVLFCGHDRQHASLLLESDQDSQAIHVLEGVDIASAAFDQKLNAYKMLAELYRKQGRYGYAIDQYINIKALPGVSAAERAKADERIGMLQDESL